MAHAGCNCRVRSWWNNILYKRQLTSNVLQVGGSVVKHRRMMWTIKNWRIRNDFALGNLLLIASWGVSWKESFLMFLILEIRNYLFSYFFLVRIIRPTTEQNTRTLPNNTASMINDYSLSSRSSLLNLGLAWLPIDEIYWEALFGLSGLDSWFVIIQSPCNVTWKVSVWINRDIEGYVPYITNMAPSPGHRLPSLQQDEHRYRMIPLR